MKGTIEEVRVKNKTVKGREFSFRSYRIGDTWYNGAYDFSKFEVGQTIEFNTVDNGYGPQLVEAKVVEDSPKPLHSGGGSGRTYRNNGEKGGFPLHPQSYERALDRRNALVAAVQYIGTKEATVEDVIDIARKFEAYTTGDSDFVDGVFVGEA